ncbi:MAG TPA: hypothetical protein VMF30_13345 [Pirellulales bacterium]|nr:hypothetical protein [Pirellulales bacterium]
MPKNLCDSCGWMREIVTPRGSRFLLCQLSSTNSALPRYPRQPMLRCEYHQTRPIATEPPPDAS